jgi:hypothetical protein
MILLIGVTPYSWHQNENVALNKPNMSTNPSCYPQDFSARDQIRRQLLERPLL